jgi:MFS family permease
VATAFAFMLRVQLMGTWEAEFNLTKTQSGTIFGAGFWPFGVSIVLFSLVLDRIGYRKAMIFAFVCHVLFAVMTIFANGFHMLYWGSVIGGLAAGTVEAVINPLIATVYARQKTKWLNILHAGWPGGLVVTGVVVILMTGKVDWRWQIGLILIPTLIYGWMMATSHFPVSERVAAGVSDREMLAHMGWAGAFIVAFIMATEICGNVLAPLFDAEGTMASLLRDHWTHLGVGILAAVLFWGYTRSFGRPMYVFLLLVMLLLATTELGTDSWVKDLLGPSMKDAFSSIADPSRWVLVYTAFIMMMLRFFCGPIVESLKPLGVLAASAGTAALGIWWLSVLGLDENTGAFIIILACTVYGIGQTFFWPTTLGLVSEQFPKGGAITLNVIAGVGMLGVGVLGNPWLGNIQDTTVTSVLQEKNVATYEKVIFDEPKQSLFGEYQAIDPGKRAGTSAVEQAEIAAAERQGKMEALRKVSILPVLMLVSYVGLMLYFKARGGYKPVELDTGN